MSTPPPKLSIRFGSFHGEATGIVAVVVLAVVVALFVLH